MVANELEYNKLFENVDETTTEAVSIGCACNCPANSTPEEIEW